MTELAGWDHSYSGKVRDLYTNPAHPDRLLMVASDRVSAFDHVLKPTIPGKGAILTGLSLWWFDQFSGMPNQLAPRDEWQVIPAEVAGRATLVTRLSMFPIECVARGYLSGSSWVEYQKTQSICGVELPAGLTDGARLPEPIYTPAWKAPMGQHDENITFERTAEMIGLDNATALRDLTLTIFARAQAISEERGVILADTKFEFGQATDGTIALADEVLTPDSSRYWDAQDYAIGRIASFDKQIVRDWLKANWDLSTSSAAEAGPPPLPLDIVTKTAARYRELVDRITK
ncbi:MAG TPA: phosphoribosylaminoimidazolesuccinocarboxamide synthase [Galbitalea sp.]|nr:phosphoribosylaminoimidazolesuccinocarboxamide synthase [Galbitalea sp.]